MVVPVQNPTVMGYFELAVKCNSDVVKQPSLKSIVTLMKDGLKEPPIKITFLGTFLLVQPHLKIDIFLGVVHLTYQFLKIDF